MIKIKDNEIEKYHHIKKDEQFLYDTGTAEFFGIKYNDCYAILINCSNEFIIAKVYKNCLSIGSGTILEFSSYYDAVRAIHRSIHYIEEKQKM